MAYGSTMEEIEQSIQHFQKHDVVHIRFGPGYLDCKSSLVREAWDQIKHTVKVLETGVADPKEHRAEALLLMILQEAYYHGYTPQSHKATFVSKGVE